MSESTSVPRRGRPTQLSAEAAGNATVLIGLELLKTIAKANRSMPLTEIARSFGMSASRTHRYLSSLHHAGFVRKDDITGHYEIGPATIDLGISAMNRVDGAQLAAATMRELTSLTGLCSYLCVWGSNGPTVVRNEMGDVQTAVRMSVGTNLSMLTATGQIFLAFMPAERTRDILRRDIEEWQAESPDSTASLEKSLRASARVRKLCLARTQGMRNPTWTAFSCPVFDSHANFRMALTLIGVSSMFDTRIDGPVANHLRDFARRLSSSTLV